MGQAKRRTESISTPSCLSPPPSLPPTSLSSSSPPPSSLPQLGQQGLEIWGSDIPPRPYRKTIPLGTPGTGNCLILFLCTQSTEMQTWMKFERKPYVCTPPCDQFANYSPSTKRKESLNTLKSAPILSTLSSGRRPVLQSVTIFCLPHLGWTRGRGRQGSEIHRDVCPPHPLPFLRGDRRLQEKWKK